MITSADWLSVLCCCRAMSSLAFVCIHHILARPGLLRDFLLSLLFHQTCHFQSLLLCSVLPIFFFGTMTSADFCRFSCVLRHRLSFFLTYQQISPGTRTIFPSIYLPHLLSIAFGNQDFVLFCRLIQLSLAYMRFVFLRPEFCRRLPSDSTSRWTPLP